MKISVILSSYNYAGYIKEAIDSVIEQTYKNWELIIVDDGSSDNSVEIIESYCNKDSRIKLLQHDDKLNHGLKETLLLGLKHATGAWIAFLESDDYLSPYYLARKVEVITNAQRCEDTKMSRCVEKVSSAAPLHLYASSLPFKLIFNKVKFSGEEKISKKRLRIVKKTQNKLSKITFPKNMFYDFYIDNMILTFSCVMVEANTIKNADFNTPNDSTLDRWLWVHLAYNNDFYYIDEELTRWRLHEKSYIKAKPRFFFPQISAYGDVYKKNPKISLWLWILYSNIRLIFIKSFRIVI